MAAGETYSLAAISYVGDHGNVRVVVRVYPNAKRTVIGGRYGVGEPAVLVVRVQAPAVEGKANDAVVAALADAFDLPKSAVQIISGHIGRTKTVNLDGIDEAAVQQLLSRTLTR